MLVNLSTEFSFLFLLFTEDSINKQTKKSIVGCLSQIPGSFEEMKVMKRGANKDNTLMIKVQKKRV